MSVGKAVVPVTDCARKRSVATSAKLYTVPYWLAKGPPVGIWAATGRRHMFIQLSIHNRQHKALSMRKRSCRLVGKLRLVSKFGNVGIGVKNPSLYSDTMLSITLDF